MKGLRGIALIAWLTALPALAQDPPVATDLEEISRVRLRAVRLRIEPRAEATEGECLALDTPHLTVRLRGDLLPPEDLIELDRSRVPTIHAIVLDTSSSMVGHLGFVRDAAREYVEQLQPDHERVLIVTFDENVLLLQGTTDDRAAANRRLDGVRMSGATSLYDAVYYAARELESHAARGVILLLTDGVDTASFHERWEVNRLVDSLPDLTVFTIGVQLPEPSAFLPRLSHRTNGKFFDVPTSPRVDRAFLRIRELLDNEATLLILDPDADAEPGRVRVRSRNPNCRVEVMRERGASDERPQPVVVDDAALPQTIPFPPGDSFLRLATRAGHVGLEASCDVDGEGRATPVQTSNDDDPGWRLVAEPGRMTICAMDLSMEPGVVFDTFMPSGFLRFNPYAYIRTREIDVPVPPVGELPRHPVELMDALGRYSLTVVDNKPVTDPLAVPRDDHARPYEDYTGLIHGKTFMDARWPLARGLYLYPEYREWVRQGLERDAERDLERLRERFRRISPESPEELIDLVARESEEGRAILARVATPTAVDLQQYLAAWLGDVPAHDLFVGWELRRANEWLAGNEQADASDFEEQWTELRRIFFAPSYARVLMLATPILDEARDRIGYWRVVLPRPGWLGARVDERRDHPDWKDLPLDLVPDLPLGLRALRRALELDPELEERLANGEYRVEELRYELMGVTRNDEPNRAYREVRVTSVLRPPPGPEGEALSLVAEYGWDRKARENRLELLRLGDVELYSAEGDRP